MIFIST